MPIGAGLAYADRIIIQDEKNHDLFLCIDLNGDLWFLTDDFDDFVYFSDELGSLNFETKHGNKKGKGNFKDQDDIEEDLDEDDIRGTLKGKFKVNGKGAVVFKDKTNGQKINIRDNHVEREGGDCARRGHPDDHVSP
jgi:hypothetical protein